MSLYSSLLSHFTCNTKNRTILLSHFIQYTTLTGVAVHVTQMTKHKNVSVQDCAMLFHIVHYPCSPCSTFNTKNRNMSLWCWVASFVRGTSHSQSQYCTTPTHLDHLSSPSIFPSVNALPCHGILEEVPLKKVTARVSYRHMLTYVPQIPLPL